MNKQEYIDTAEQELLHTYNRFSLVLDHGEGVYLYDTDKKAYLDFAAGIAVCALGYSNEAYKNALKDQVDKLLHTSNLYYNVPTIEAAKKALKASGMDRIFFTNSGTEAIEGALKAAKNNGTIISYDPNYRASLWKDEETAKKQMRSLVPYVDIMKISDEETKLLTDKESPEEATEILFRKGVKIVAVTLGSDGAYLYCKEGGVHIPGFVSKAVDTNGAGDSFWGGFLYCISKAGKRPEAFTMDELKEYVRFGNAVASLCVERKGAIPAMPELAQVEERMGR